MKLILLALFYFLQSPKYGDFGLGRDHESIVFPSFNLMNERYYIREVQHSFDSRSSSNVSILYTYTYIYDHMVIYERSQGQTVAGMSEYILT